MSQELWRARKRDQQIGHQPQARALRPPQPSPADIPPERLPAALPPPTTSRDERRAAAASPAARRASRPAGPRQLELADGPAPRARPGLDTLVPGNPVPADPPPGMGDAFTLRDIIPRGPRDHAADPEGDGFNLSDITGR